jgi:hypothetical protein
MAGRITVSRLGRHPVRMVLIDEDDEGRMLVGEQQQGVGVKGFVVVDEEEEEEEDVEGESSTMLTPFSSVLGTSSVGESSSSSSSCSGFKALDLKQPHSLLFQRGRISSLSGFGFASSRVTWMLTMTSKPAASAITTAVLMAGKKCSACSPLRTIQHSRNCLTHPGSRASDSNTGMTKDAPLLPARRSTVSKPPREGGLPQGPEMNERMGMGEDEEADWRRRRVKPVWGLMYKLIVLKAGTVEAEEGEEGVFERFAMVKGWDSKNPIDGMVRYMC